MKLTVQELVARLNEGGSFDEFLESQQTPLEQELWRCCALVRTFSPAFVAYVLKRKPAPSDEPLTFTKLVASPDVERVPQSKELHRLKDSSRRRCLDQWRASLKSFESYRDSLRALGQELLVFYQNDSQNAELDILWLLIAVDSQKAADHFVKLFDEADAQFNLGRCQALLQVIEEQSKLLGDVQSNNLNSLLWEKRQQLRGRSLFIEEYYQTVAYYERKDIFIQFERFLRSDTKWILQLQAPGGLGKTIFLRYLVSRYCVPQRIPCARIDFDFLHLPTVRQHPWLLLLPIAEQLNQQTAKPTLGNVLDRLRPFAAVLRPPTAVAAWSTQEVERVQKTLASESNLEKQIQDRFESAIREIAIDRHQQKIVLMFDTLEVAMLSHHQSLMEFIGYLRKMQPRLPQLKLILSGRYDLAEKIPRFRSEYPRENGPTEFCVLKPFSNDEAKVYLVQKRHLSNKHPVQAIVRKAKGHPFKLRLWAELAQSRCSLTEREVNESPDVEVAHLIERVVERIPFEENPLRWILRYGVVPRRLTFPLLRDVMAEHLAREIAGEGIDRANESLWSLAPIYGDRKTWKTEKDADPTPHLEVLWNRLREYSSQDGWITFEGDVARFQPDVVHSMRQLLQQEQTLQKFIELNESFFAYFEGQASAANERGDDQAWGNASCEAIYHQFQMHGTAALKFWHEKLNSEVCQKNPVVLKQISEEVIGPEYIDEEGKPLFRYNQTPLIDEASIAEAHFLVAEAAVSLAKLGDGDSDELWAEADEHFKRSRSLGYRVPAKKTMVVTDILASQIDQPGIPGTATVSEMLSEAAQIIRNGELELAVELLNHALKLQLEDHDRLEIHIQLAESLSKLNRAIAVDHYQQAMELCEAKWTSPKIGQRIATQFARLLRQRDQYQDAVRTFERAMDWAERAKDCDSKARLQLELIALHLREHELDSAHKCLRLARKQSLARDRNFQAQLEVFQGRILLESLQPKEALRKVSAVTRKSSSDSVQNGDFHATADELLGDIYGSLMKFQDAENHLDIAKSSWGSISDQASESRCRMKLIRLLIEGVGDLAKAASQLETADRYSRDLPEESIFELRQLQLEFHRIHAQYDEANAEQAWQKLHELAATTDSPRLRAMVFATGLALQMDEGRRSELQTALIQAISKIQSISARFQVLDVFRYAPYRHPADAELRDAVMKHLPPPHKKSLNYLPHTLILTDILRFVGDKDKAQSLLSEAAQFCKLNRNSFGYREVLLAYDSWMSVMSLPEVGLHAMSFLSHYKDFDILRGAALLEHGMRLLKEGEFTSCRKVLQTARAVLDKNRRSITRWHAHLEEASAMLSQELGEEEAATEHFHLAASLFQDLDPPSAPRREQRTGTSLPGVSDPATTIRLNQQADGGMAITWETGPGSPYSFQIVVKPEKLHLWQSHGSTNFSYDLMKEFTFKSRIAERMGDLLFPDAEPGLRQLHTLTHSMVPESALTDLRIRVLPGMYSAVPWELARYSRSGGWLSVAGIRYFYRLPGNRSTIRELVKWVQCAINVVSNTKLKVDGIYGRRTREAVRRMQTAAGLLSDGIVGSKTKSHLIQLLREKSGSRPAGVVLVLEPSFERIHGAMVGSGVQISSLYGNYRSSTLPVLGVNDPTIEGIQFWLSRESPNVLHLVGTLQEQPTTSEIFLDLTAGGRGSSSGQADNANSVRLTASLLNSLLSVYPVDRPRPLIILDILKPPGITEIAIQLFLRNLFASELFELGCSWAVLATGLGTAADQKAQLHHIMTGLQNGDPIGQIASTIRTTNTNPIMNDWDEDMESVIPTVGSALFTVDPELPGVTPFHR